MVIQQDGISIHPELVRCGHLLGDPEVTANLCCNFAVFIYIGKMRDLKYIFAVTSGSPSMYDFMFSYNLSVMLEIHRVRRHRNQGSHSFPTYLYFGLE